MVSGRGFSCKVSQVGEVGASRPHITKQMTRIGHVPDMPPTTLDCRLLHFWGANNKYSQSICSLLHNFALVPTTISRSIQLLLLKISTFQ